MYPSSLEKLIQCFRKLPSVGQKTAERYAMQILQLPKEEIEEFSQQLLKVVNDIHRCPICGNLTDRELCPVCEDKQRDKSIICVVQEPKDVIAIERLGQYNGVYHVLHGAIAISKGILAEDINLNSLLERIDENTKEIIIATNSTVEGETTALYITKLLSGYDNIEVTRLASGLPMGGNLDYADELTLMRALERRVKI
ncbi:MAG: recombination protein RecR [Erysipelotrichaceae bacterium]|nr:recombination protein RecR [Erysipelotrichaceae bacterium]